jgi:hypothetical protein
VPTVELVVEPWALSVCRLGPRAAWPPPPPGAAVHSVTRTPDELSVVCVEGHEPEGARVEPGWRALRIVGPLDFGLVGIVASVTVPLAGSQIGVFVLSTFDTDLVLVKGTELEAAAAVLEKAGHTVTSAPPEH